LTDRIPQPEGDHGREAGGAARAVGATVSDAVTVEEAAERATKGAAASQ